MRRSLRLHLMGKVLSPFMLGIMIAVASVKVGATTVTRGDIVVLEQGNLGGPGNGNTPVVPAALIKVDPQTGLQSVISSGGLLVPGIGGFAYDPTSNSFVVVGRDQNVFRVDASSGQQALVGQLPVYENRATGIAIEDDGDFLVADFGVLFRMSRDGTTVSVLASGGLLASMWPAAVEIDASGNAIVSGLTLGGVSDGASRLVLVDAATGAQRLIAEITNGNFYDFALSNAHAFTAISTRGGPSSSSLVADVNLDSGSITPLFAGLNAVLDVDIDEQGRFVVLDQCRALSPCAGSPVVYRSDGSGGLTILSTDGYMFVPGRLVIIGPRPCSDGLDNDGDGLTDFPADPGCDAPDDSTEPETCTNGLDDDGDGLVDFGADPGCVASTDNSEREATLVCDDGQDNDLDGDFDYPTDPGCASPSSSTEGPACDDGRDNDYDGRVDWDGAGLGAPDPQCTTPLLATEQKSCGLGAELVLVLGALGLLTRRIAVARG